MKRKVLHISCGGLGSGGVSSVIFSIVKELHNRKNIYDKCPYGSSKFATYNRICVL